MQSFLVMMRLAVIECVWHACGSPAQQPASHPLHCSKQTFEASQILKQSILGCTWQRRATDVAMLGDVVTVESSPLRKEQNQLEAKKKKRTLQMRRKKKFGDRDHNQNRAKKT
jgi:hypothetical protein